MVIVEKSFPRGGQVKAPAAVPEKHRFGAKTLKSKKATTGQKNKSEKQKLKKKKRKSNADKGLVAKSAVPISRKTIQEGMLVMGYVTLIEKANIILSLPGKLQGSVKVTCISDAYTKSLEEFMDPDSATVKVTHMEDLFTVGQSVYCKVLAFPAASSKYFDVSLNPKDTHSEFTHNNLNQGMLLTGAIASWEDHGAVIDLGIANTRCFLARSPKTAGLVVGQLVSCRIEELTKTASTANVKLSLVADESNREVDLDMVEKLDYLVPTSQVQLTVLNNTLKNGLSGKILDGQFEAFINEQHLGAGKSLRDFEVGQDVTATVLYVMPLTKFVYLTLNTFVPAKKRLPEGSLHNNVAVLGVHASGVLLRLDKNSLGLISVRHLKAMKSSGETSLEDLQRKYENAVKQVRIINYDPMDGVYLCTDDAKLLTEKYFRLADVSVGQLIKCRVKEPLKTHGVLVKIGQLNGFIYKSHLCKTLVKSRVGATIKARVLYLDEAKQSVHLTTLKEFLRAEEQRDLLVDVKEAQVGADYLGTVTSVTPKLVFVEFFNKIIGTLQNVTSGQRPLGAKVSYTIGSVQRFNVSRVQGDRLQLSAGKQKAVHAVGEFVEGTVRGAFDTGIELEVPSPKGNTISVWVDKDFTTEFPELAAAMSVSYKRGESVSVVALNGSTYSVRDVWAFQRYPMVAKTTLRPGKSLRAVVVRVDASGLTVQVPLLDGAQTAKVPFEAALMNDQVKNKPALFTPNQVVYVKLSGPVNKETKNLPLSARLDMTFTGNGHATINYLKDYFTHLDRVQRPMFEANDFKWHIGAKVDGEVMKVLVVGREYEISFGGSFKGNLRTDEKLTLKEEVQCVITWVDESGRIYLSNDEELLNVKTKRNLPRRLIGKRNGRIVHKTKYCYVVLLPSSKCYVFVPVRLHYNDFQPVMDNRSGECSVVVMHVMGERLLALFADVYDKMVELGMEVGPKKRPLVLASKGDSDAEIEDDAANDDSEADDDEEDEQSEVEEVVEVPKKKKQKLAEPEETQTPKKKKKENPEVIPNPVVIDEKNAMSNFWTMDFTTVQSSNSKSTDFDMDLDEEEEGDGAAKKKTQKQGPTETDIRNLEEALASSANIPSSTAEFERLVLATPNNSLIWIKFMVFHLQALEVEKARNVFRRALKAINFRWQGDILNVWVAYLNLELRYGTPESFEQAFSEALATNDQFKVTMRTVEILADSEKIAMCKAKVTVAMKKFKERAELWPKIGAAYFRIGLKEEANQLVNKALAVLDKRDHLQVIVEFAKLNRANGQMDVASTLLEQILTSYPKRTDIWSFYIDMLVKENQVESARSILERATSQKLPAKKMKTLFKKYLEFEERFGDANAVEHVKKMAAEYVQSQQ